MFGIMLASFAVPLPAKALDRWIRLDPDGRIIVFAGKAELGQGILTALAQIAAEELDVEIAQVQIIEVAKLASQSAVSLKSIRNGSLRTLGALGNIFAIESFMDELANLAKIDPVSFRLMHLKDERAKAVINAAVTRAGWT
jgi:CO/xanthine dehydrogenase Mo-binding subunit